MKQKHFLFLVGFVIASRIPFLVTGFGADGDGWRVARSALSLWNDGIYIVSRFPGFPMYEIVNSPLIGIGGSLASNTATLAVFLISLYAFRKIVEQWNVQMSELLITSYAFFPLLWTNSALTMDYVWGLCGILIAVWMISSKKYLFAGLAIGFAAGTRITHIAFILPLFFLFERAERNQWILFAVVALTTAVLCYLPVISSETYPLIVKEYIADVRYYPLWKKIGFYWYRLIYSVGIVGFVTSVFVMVLQREKIVKVISHRLFLTSVLCSTLVMVLFAFLPDQREYLIPMVPFLLISVFFIGSRRQIILIVLSLLSYSFISIDVIEHSIKSPSLKLSLQKGYVVKEWTDRIEIDDWKKRVTSLNVPDSSMIMIGVGPIFGMENSKVINAEAMEKYLRQDCYKAKERNEVYYVYSLYFPQLAEMRLQGFKIYYVDTMRDYLETFIGYSLAQEHVERLETSMAIK